MTTQAQHIAAVLNRLRSALGTAETPDGSNHNFITEWYNANVAKIGNGPWCEMTVTWAMWTGGAKALKKGRAYTVWGAEDGVHQENGSSWHSGTAGMQAGDQVYYDWSGSKSISKIDHTGVAEKINGDGTFYTLEGNTSNHLQRKLRDGKYVVGYVRFDWARLNVAGAPPVVTPPPKAKKTPTSTGERDKVRHIQSALEVNADGLWGPTTDQVALLMRAAARAHAGYPHNVNVSFYIKAAQRIVDTVDDGIWGPNSQSHLVNWIKSFQHALGVTADGQWGPRTDAAFLVARKRNLNNF